MSSSWARRERAGAGAGAGAERLRVLLLGLHLKVRTGDDVYIHGMGVNRNSTDKTDAYDATDRERDRASARAYI